MIVCNNNVFHITTANTSYIFRADDNGFLENLHYGRKIKVIDDYSPLYEKHGCGYGNSIVCPEDATLTLDNICLEMSYGGIGDFRHLPIDFRSEDGYSLGRFLYRDYKIYKGIYINSDETKMPHGLYGDDVFTLEISLLDSVNLIEIVLVYTVYEQADVISRRTIVTNGGDNNLVIEKLMSMSLDLPDNDYVMTTFDGAWARERHTNSKKLTSGIFVNSSTTGVSSNRHNPLVMISRGLCDEDYGECMGFNLIYSGNHYEAVEVSPFNKLRIMTGINPEEFKWTLNKNETFYSPEAIMSYSKFGKNGLSKNFHRFINENLINPKWVRKERPILINNWEATYFDFNESKLISIAKEAAKLGIELFVLDDGWFGNRSDDTSSLGDWFVNEKKIGGSLEKLSKKIKDIGLDFGLWVEPEMISRKSKLYEEHPDWAVCIPNRIHYQGRNQMVLDYTNTEVRDYIVEIITNIINSGHISYIKWDMNRPISDGYSPLLLSRQGEFYHRYVLGLYDVMNRITSKFPEVLFEGCSAGGNRFDLGILYYMPQIWTSDDTDANERIDIQTGTSYGYPLSTMSAHVSAVPNHQTLRTIDLETRFNVAMFGVLGYELDITKLSSAEKKIVKRQIEFYKEHRMLLQFGQFHKSVASNGNVIWQVTDRYKKCAIAMLYQRLATPNISNDILKVVDLLEDDIYNLENRPQAISIKQFGSLVNQVSPVDIVDQGVMQALINKVYMLESEKEEYQVTGSMLEVGVKLLERFVGIGYDESIRPFTDFSSRVYIIEERTENNG